VLVARAEAWAAEPDDATKNAARDLAQRAAEAYEAGDHAAAQDLFHRAYALVPAPTLSLREARALEKLGRLVEAVEAYVRTTRTPVDPAAPEVFRHALSEAAEELAQLRPRVPRLKITVEGADPSGLDVTVDGKPLRRELIGVSTPIDPGTHSIVGTAASGSGTASVTLKEGEESSIVLRIEPGKTSDRAAAHAQGKKLDVEGRGRDRGATQRTWAIVSFAAGGAGLGVGVVTGLMATSRHSKASVGCPENRCIAGSPAADDVDAFRSLRTVSTIGYVFGAVGVAAGTTLLLTAPKEKTSGWVGPYLGPASAGVTGKF